MNYYLGIDGGGTKMLAAVLDADGRERGRGTGGPGSLATCTDAELRQSLHEAFQGACVSAGLSSQTRFAGVCAGMAGVSLIDRRAAFTNILTDEVSAERYAVEPDFVTAYWGAAEGEPGIAVIAGTGAVCYGRNAAGDSMREDGLGYLLGDRGSGFNLGLRVLRYTLDALRDGRDDALTAAVTVHTGATTQSALLQWLYGNFSPARVASLAPVIGSLAEAGDPAARTHVAAMARQLRHSVRQLRHKLWLPHETPVYLLGGLWNIGVFFRSEFLDPQYPVETSDNPMDAVPGGCFHAAEPKHDAVYGAALLARIQRQV